jgi:hypothetical protein
MLHKGPFSPCIGRGNWLLFMRGNWFTELLVLPRSVVNASQQPIA